MGGFNGDTKMLCHFNGTDAATTTTDATGRHTFTFLGTSQIDTDQKKWGVSSLYLPATNGWLTSDDHADWDIAGSTSTNITIDFQAKFGDHAGDETLLTQYEGNNDNWTIRRMDTSGWGLVFRIIDGGVYKINIQSSFDIADTNWHHIAVCKVGTEWGLYSDGIQKGYATLATTHTFAGKLVVGALADGGSELFYGWIDELRIHYSNYFSATPVVGVTDDWSARLPTAEYSVIGKNKAYIL